MNCPNCFNALSVRATTISKVADDGLKTTGKFYYLACFFCRWTTRDVGVSDQTAGGLNLFYKSLLANSVIIKICI